MTMKLWGVSAERWMEVKNWFESSTDRRIDSDLPLGDFIVKYQGEYTPTRYVPSNALAWMGTDPQRWAQHFLELHRDHLVDGAEGLMAGWWEELLTGWFSNALQAGESSTYKILPLPDLLNEITLEKRLNEVERQEGIAYRWLRENLPWPLRGLIGYPRILKLAIRARVVKVPSFVHYRS